MKTRTHWMACYVAAALAVVAFIPTYPSYGREGNESALDRTYQAHGGLDQWRKQRAFTYTLNGFPLSPQVAKPNTSTVDLRYRYNRIEGEGFTMGFDGKRAWSTPGPEAVGLPPRFFSLGSFYFIGMPFVLPTLV